jgi:hypothetical protein
MCNGTHWRSSRTPALLYPAMSKFILQDNDPGITQWAQPDTIIPELYNSLAYQRYAYVRYNSVRYTDPSCHKACVENTVDGKCVVDPSWHPAGLGRYGITAKGVSSQARNAVRIAAEDIAHAFWGMLGYQDATSLSTAFRIVYSGGIFFQQSAQSCKMENGTTCWGNTVNNGDGSITINIYTDANNKETTLSEYYNNFLVHEMGHAFDISVGLKLSTGYSDRIDKISNGWTNMPIGNDGFASPTNLWIQGVHSDGYVEEVADMFLGWVYSSWGSDIHRANWMHLWMSSLTTNNAPPSITAQYNCNEGNGEGC